MQKYQKPIIVFILMLVFATLFLRNVRHDFPLIFQKDLLAHDESSNSVVAANITRQFFPPMVRVNPLNNQQGNWMEGPFWQHIPPLFAYVPYLFFKLDGQVTIEVKRLSYAFVTLLTGLLFIFSVYKYRKSLWAAASATIASILWINTPFTHELITGYAFGVSDIVLAFTVVAGFCAILWYLQKKQEERIAYPYWKLIVIAMIVALPIAAKNLLGGIPAATFFILLLRDHKKINKPVLFSSGAFVGLLLLHLLPLYFSSPETFKSEILVSFYHFRQLEGWGRPWYWYVTNYLPQRYLLGWTWVYYSGLTLGLIINFKLKILNRHDKILLWLSGGWFVWNLLAISVVTSKVPNFIYQSYLLSLFFIVYALIIVVSRFIDSFKLINQLTTRMLAVILVVSLVVTSYEIVHFTKQFKLERAQAYNYSSEHEKFYQTAEELRTIGFGTKDLIIVRVSDNDCWFRYYPLFLTGTESKTLLEMNFGFDSSVIKQKYQRMYFVENKDKPDFGQNRRVELANYSLLEFDLNQLNSTQIKQIVDSFISFHKADIATDILRIKQDKTSCQWLVPDAILNAP